MQLFCFNVDKRFAADSSFFLLAVVSGTCERAARRLLLGLLDALRLCAESQHRHGRRSQFLVYLATLDWASLSAGATDFDCGWLGSLLKALLQTLRQATESHGCGSVKSKAL